MDEPATDAERSRQLRAEIIDAAIDVIAERGYHHAGVADIASRVKIGHSTFYRQFQSKREVLDAVVDTVLQRMLSAAAVELTPVAAGTLAEFRDQVRRLVMSIDEIVSDLRVVRLLVIESLSVDAALEERVFGGLDLLIGLATAYLDQGRQAGFLRADLDSAATARAMVAMALGGSVQGLSPNLDRRTRDAAIEAALLIVFEGIATG